ncbi:uncharacterized protein LOC102485237 [Tupaia chinensis]|uniref:uncharacterized protein LOC102485237 n=1 Tax=Tupaia chinensis TaxID=246437 RepID=UPI000FFC1828|nr:uncharacterized protein LOC102485237 [Tupaia chinensis]
MKIELTSKENLEPHNLLDGWQVDVHDLGNMALRLTPEELNDLTPNLPVDGEDVDVSDVKCVLENKGIELTPKGSLKLMNNLRADGDIFDDSELDTVLQTMKMNLTENEINDLKKNLPVDGKVTINNLDTFLEYLGIKLTQKERDDVTEILPLDASGKVEVNKLMNAVAAVTGGEVSVSEIKNNLEKIGIELTDEECLELEKDLPVDASGKVYQNRLMDGVKNLQGGVVDVTKLDTVLQNMGMELTGMESQDLRESLPVDVNQKVEMKKLMNAMKAFTGTKVDANDLQKVLENMGIALTEKECMNLQQIIPIDAAGQVYQNRLLEAVKSMKGGRVMVNNLDTVLDNLGIKLTEKEHEDLTENLPLSANGKIEFSKLLETVETITGGEVDVDGMENVLGEMGITITDKEHEKLVKSLPVNANGKVYKNRLLDGLKSLDGGIIDVNKLDLILKHMGWSLTKEEIKDLQCNLPSDVNGKVAMRKLFSGLKAFTGQKIDVQHIPEFLSNMGVELTNKEQMKLISKLPVDASGKIYKNRLFDGMKSFKGGKVKRSKVDDVLGNMGIKLTEKEFDRLADNLPVNATGKVNLNELMDGVKNVTGGEANIRELKDVLESMGMELTEKELSELVKNLPVDNDGNFYQNRLMDGVKSLTGGQVDINKLDTVLRNMRMNVSEKEHKDMVKNLPVDVDGKVEIKKLMDRLKAFTGKKISINDLQNILESMGIELTEEEFLNLLKTLPYDDAGMVFQNRLLDGVKSLKGGKVKVDSMDTILENMGIKLTESELKDLAENLRVNADGKVDLDEFMDGVKSLTGEIIDVSDMKNVLGNMGINLTEKECSKLLKNLPVDADGKIYQNRLVNGVKSLKGGMIDVNKLDTVLRNMGISLTEKELKDLIQNLPVGADGQVTLKNVMDEVKNFSGKKVDVGDLQSLLRNMGIELTDQEYSELKKTLPMDGTGQVFQNRVLDGVKSLKGGMVSVSDLNKVLENFGIKLTEKELEGLTENLPVDANGKIVLNKLVDEVKTVTGEDFDICDINDVLENMGIELTDEECSELMKMLSVDADGKLYQNRLLEGIKTLKKGKVDASKLDTVLGNMRMNLAEKELKDLIQSLPVDVDGKVDMKKMMDEVKAYTGEKIDTNNLEKILRNMGIELADTDYAKLMKTMPLSDDGKVHQNRVLQGLKSFKRGKVYINKLSPLLEKMGIKLTEKELVQLKENLPVDANGKVDLNKVMDRVKDITGGQVDIEDIKTVLKNMGIELEEKEFLELVKNLLFDDNGKIFQNRLLEGVKALKGVKVNINNLNTVLDTMGIKLKDKELKDLTQNLPGGGKQVSQKL